MYQSIYITHSAFQMLQGLGFGFGFALGLAGGYKLVGPRSFHFPMKDYYVIGEHYVLKIATDTEGCRMARSSSLIGKPYDASVVALLQHKLATAKNQVEKDEASMALNAYAEELYNMPPLDHQPPHGYRWTLLDK